MIFPESSVYPIKSLYSFPFILIFSLYVFLDVFKLLLSKAKYFPHISVVVEFSVRCRSFNSFLKEKEIESSFSHKVLLDAILHILSTKIKDC